MINEDCKDKDAFALVKYISEDQKEEKLLAETIESLGKAEYTIYDDGSVESITFYTTSFSSFFTSTTELSILDSILVAEEELDKDNYLWIWGIVTVAVVGGAIVCVALAKKKYNRI